MTPLFDPPPQFLDLGLHMRPETGADTEFLLLLYLSVRWPELEATNWPDAAKHAFLQSQFQIQTQQYRANYPGMERWVVESGAGPVGRMYLLLTDAELRLVDLALLPDWRNRGVGTAQLRELGRQADKLGKPLRLHVEQHNPALRLYRRLGFEERETAGLYWLMERVRPRDETDTTGKTQTAANFENQDGNDA
jgi:ribosomal protein S18 acetylase RimI-like enzyme